MLRGYAGVAVHDDVLWFDPLLPDGVERIAFDLLYRGQPVSVELLPTSLRLFLHPCAAAPIQVEVTGTRRSLAAGEAYEFPIAAAVRDGQP